MLLWEKSVLQTNLILLFVHPVQFLLHPLKDQLMTELSLLLLSTLLGWKVGGPLRVTKDGKSDKSTNPWLERWLSC